MSGRSIERALPRVHPTVVHMLAEAAALAGAREALLCGNSLDLPIAMFAAHAAGAQAVPINPAYTARELGHILVDAAPRVVIYDAEIADTVEPLLGSVHFVNADLIAGGLSPLRPELASLAAGRLFLNELDRLAKRRRSFAFESTLSGLGNASRLRKWQAAGFRIEIIYLKLRSTRLALRRIAARVRQGGHDVPRNDVLRRFRRSWENFERIYRSLADRWTVYDNSASEPQLVERGP